MSVRCSLEHGKKVMFRNGYAEIKRKRMASGEYLLVGRKPSEKYIGDKVTCVFHFTREGVIYASDLFIRRGEKYLLAPTRTYYPSMKKERLMIPRFQFLGQPLWVD